MLRRFGGIGLFLLVGVLAIGFVGGMLATPAPITLAVPIAVPTPPAVPTPIAVSTPSVVPSIAENVKPANSKVEPGKVHWHATTELALAAAMMSKKPVLVFHMMGQLDHQFC